MSVIIIIFIIIMVIYFTKDNKKIDDIITVIISKKLKKPNKMVKIKPIRNKIKKMSDNRIIKKISNKRIKKNNIKKYKTDNKSNPPKIIKKKKPIIRSKVSQSVQNTIKVKKFDSKDSLLIKNLEKDVSINVISFMNANIIPKTGINQLLSIKEEYNDEELNSMDYKNAIKYDKRTYMQYYWSLIKKKHLIIFTFLPNNDYNLISIKISLFLVSFSLFFTINGFFFNDITMHKIYINLGNINIIYQIPQIVFSSVISIIINYLLKILALSERDILQIKRKKVLKDLIQEAKYIKNFLKRKIIIFFIICFLLLSFFWYFISCFCGIFINTQIILIKDTFASFLVSLIYPFGLNFIPGIFRIIALRNKQKHKNCIYNFSKVVSLI